MYNLSVDVAHTFYVGDGQWLVHNAPGKPVAPIQKTYEMALNPQLYVDAIAKKYGVNLRNVQLVYDPTLGAGIKGKTLEAEGGKIIRIGKEALMTGEADIANTIAHELNHARAYQKGVKAFEDPAIKAGDALQEYIEGCR